MKPLKFQLPFEELNVYRLQTECHQDIGYYNRIELRAHAEDAKAKPKALMGQGQGINRFYQLQEILLLHWHQKRFLNETLFQVQLAEWKYFLQFQKYQ